MNGQQIRDLIMNNGTKDFPVFISKLGMPCFSEADAGYKAYAFRGMMFIDVVEADVDNTIRGFSGPRNQAMAWMASKILYGL